MNLWDPVYGARACALLGRVAPVCGDCGRGLRLSAKPANEKMIIVEGRCPQAGHSMTTWWVCAEEVA